MSEAVPGASVELPRKKRKRGAGRRRKELEESFYKRHATRAKGASTAELDSPLRAAGAGRGGGGAERRGAARGGLRKRGGDSKLRVRSRERKHRYIRLQEASFTT